MCPTSGWRSRRAGKPALDEVTFDPAEFSGTVPVFPLPNVVFFPGNALPLHVFEPRYRELAQAALAGERMIGVALLRPGWEKHYQGSPEFHPVIGLGKIIEDTRLEDGRFNLLLFGVARARVRDIVSSSPYRTARVEILKEQGRQGKALERRRRLLVAFYEQLLREMSQGQISSPPKDLPLGLVCDLLASVINFDPETKQAMLEEPDVEARSSRLIELLKAMNAPGSDGFGDHPRRWPPAEFRN
jgi:Lon protease-like protein